MCEKRDHHVEELKPRPGVDSDLQLGIIGTLSYSCCIETEENFRVNVIERGLLLPFDAYVLQIMKAKDLVKADLLESGPFVVIELKGEEIGRTVTINDTMNPKWSDELFVVDLTSIDLDIIPELPYEEIVSSDVEDRAPEDLVEEESGEFAATVPKSPSSSAGNWIEMDSDDNCLVLRVFDEDVPGLLGDFLGKTRLTLDMNKCPPFSVEMTLRPEAKSTLAQKCGEEHSSTDDANSISSSAKELMGGFFKLTSGINCPSMYDGCCSRSEGKRKLTSKKRCQRSL